MPSLIHPNGTSENAFNFLSNALKKNRCSIVIGPKISQFSGVKNTEALLTDFFSEIGLPLEPSPENKVEWKRFIPILRQNIANPNQELRDILSNSARRRGANEIHQLLSLLKANYYIDTNYDNLLFETLNNSSPQNLKRIVLDEHLSHDNLIRFISLNGVINNFESIVLPFESYEKRFRENPYIFHLLKSIFIQHLVLLVGFDNDDPRLEELITKMVRYKNQTTKSNICILAHNPTTHDTTFFHSIQASYVALGGESLEEELHQFLNQIWNRTTGFRVYLDVPQKLPSTYSAKLTAGIELYRLGNFQKAKEQFQSIEEEEHISDDTWVRDPGAFAQYAYFYLKTHDKLNDWKGLNEKYEYIDSIIQNIKSFIPKFVEESINALVYSVLGLMNLRAMNFDGAIEFMKVATKRGALKNFEAQVTDGELYLHADRHVILAQVYISNSYIAAPEDIESNLKEARTSIDEATRLYDSKNVFKRDKGKEVHYLGRYFGSKVFLAIAEVQHGIKNYADISVKQKGDFINWAKGSYNPQKNRPPYGIMVGKYCEAISFLFRGAQEENDNELYLRAVKQLQAILDEEEDKETASNLILSKCYRALSTIYEQMGNTKKQKEYYQQFDSAFKKLNSDQNILKEDEDSFMEKGWIYMPIN